MYVLCVSVCVYLCICRHCQAFVQSYWDGSLDGRPAGRFLQLLSVCRSLTDVCQHLDIDTAADIAQLSEVSLASPHRRQTSQRAAAAACIDTRGQWSVRWYAGDTVLPDVSMCGPSCSQNQSELDISGTREMLA